MLINFSKNNHKIFSFRENHTVIAVFESEFRAYPKPTQEPLYPHEIEKFIIVVPNLVQRKSTLFLSILQMPLLNVWALAIIIFSIFRQILRSVLKSKSHDFNSILLNTFGLTFGTAGSSANTTKISNSEQILIWFLSLFGMLASVLCSGMLFQEFVTSSLISSINSLADLGKNAHIEIWMPEDFDNSTETWLQEQLGYIHLYYNKTF